MRGPQWGGDVHMGTGRQCYEDNPRRKGGTTWGGGGEGLWRAVDKAVYKEMALGKRDGQQKL